MISYEDVEVLRSLPVGSCGDKFCDGVSKSRIWAYVENRK